MLFKKYFLCLPRGLVGMNNDRKGKFNRYTTWNGIQEQVIRSDNKGHNLIVYHMSQKTPIAIQYPERYWFLKKNKNKINDREESTHGRAVYIHDTIRLIYGGK